MESVGESRKDMNELIQIYQKLLENTSYEDMKTLQKNLEMAFKQKEMEFPGLKQEEGEGILSKTAELGKEVDNLIIQVKEASAGHEKMEVDPPPNVLVRQQFAQTGGSSGLYYLNHPENGIKLRRKVEDLTTKKVDLLSKMTSERISGKTLKPEVMPWLAKVETIMAEAENRENKLAERRFKEYEVLGRSLELKIEEAEELYKKGNFAESIVVEEIAGEKNGSSNLSKANFSLVGMGGEGNTSIENNEAVELRFGGVNLANKSEKESSGVGNETGKTSIVGMGGKGSSSIKNKGPVTMTFGDVQL